MVFTFTGVFTARWRKLFYRIKMIPDDSLRLGILCYANTFQNIFSFTHRNESDTVMGKLAYDKWHSLWAFNIPTFQRYWSCYIANCFRSQRSHLWHLFPDILNWEFLLPWTWKNVFLLVIYFVIIFYGNHEKWF